MASILQTRRVPALTYTYKSYEYNYGNKAWFVGITSSYTSVTRFKFFVDNGSLEYLATSSLSDFIVNPNDEELYYLYVVAGANPEIRNLQDETIYTVPISSTSLYNAIGTYTLNAFRLAFFDGDRFVISGLYYGSTYEYYNACCYGRISTNQTTSFHFNTNYYILPSSYMYITLYPTTVSSDGSIFTFSGHSSRSQAVWYCAIDWESMSANGKINFVSDYRTRSSFYVDGWWYYQTTSGNYVFDRYNLTTGETQTNAFTSVGHVKGSFGDVILFQTPSGTEQEVLEIITYHINYTINDNDGNVLKEITDQLPITNVNLAYSGSDATITFTYLDGTTEVSNVSFPTLENKQFCGLNVAPNAKNPLIVTGDNAVDFTADTSFYPVYETFIPITGDMVLNLYQCTAEDNRVDKTEYLTAVGALGGSFREETDLLNPEITIEQEALPNFNYVYIGALGRYYFVDSITSVHTNLWRVSLSVDVLMTYKSGIKALTAFVDRNENQQDADIIDTRRVVEQGYDVEDNVVTNSLFDTSATYIVSGFGITAEWDTSTTSATAEAVATADIGGDDNGNEQ